jgi:hypothetical protein
LRLKLIRLLHLHWRMLPAARMLHNAHNNRAAAATSSPAAAPGLCCAAAANSISSSRWPSTTLAAYGTRCGICCCWQLPSVLQQPV